MKTPFKTLVAAVMIMTFFTGCLNLQLGGGAKSEIQKPTLGQSLMDLQKAKDCGAITDAEFQTQKAKLLEAK